MTDEEGVKDRYQPTKSNLVRNFPHPLPTSTNPNNAFFQKREIRALSRQVQPGDRRVFYCTDFPFQHSISSTLIMSQLPVTLNRCPVRPAAKKTTWTRVCILSFLICLRTLSALSHQSSLPSTGSESETTFVSRAALPIATFKY